MKILILGADGYIGWPLGLHLKNRYHSVIGIDNAIRREMVRSVGSDSLTQIKSLDEKRDSFFIYPGDITYYESLKLRIFDFKPDCIVHLAEQPSAAFSMRDVNSSSYTQNNNISGTLNILWALKELGMTTTHLVKLGSMGEYGTPNVHIPEGFIQSGELKDLPFPKDPGSFYHCSKVHDSTNIYFASKAWGITCTDIMQGVVYGVNYWDPPADITRFDYDECFGTVINRFLVEALIGSPLTVYGSGEQIRGFIPLQDSIECITIAIEHPPKYGEYRVFNQLDTLYSINELAATVRELIDGEVEHIPDPRVEAQSHYYSVSSQKLKQLGYKPKSDIKDTLDKTLKTLHPYRSRIDKSVLYPKINWR